MLETLGPSPVKELKDLRRLLEVPSKELVDEVLFIEVIFDYNLFTRVRVGTVKSYRYWYKHYFGGCRSVWVDANTAQRCRYYWCIKRCHFFLRP